MAGLGQQKRTGMTPGSGIGGALMLAAILVLAGCGWKPLYERPSAAPASGGAGAELAQVAIDPITLTSQINPLTPQTTDTLYDSRAAQMLQNDLKSALNPNGSPSAALYHLEIELDQVTRAAASLGNGDATREDLVMTAKYKLHDAKGKPVLEDQSSIITSYDILREPFADLSSQRDAQQRGAQELAQAIQTRLAVFLHK